jgi:hypothetical protein
MSLRDISGWDGTSEEDKNGPKRSYFWIFLTQIRKTFNIVKLNSLITAFQSISISFTTNALQCCTENITGHPKKML